MHMGTQLCRRMRKHLQAYMLGYVREDPPGQERSIAH